MNSQTRERVYVSIYIGKRKKSGLNCVSRRSAISFYFSQEKHTSGDCSNCDKKVELKSTGVVGVKTLVSGFEALDPMVWTSLLLWCAGSIIGYSKVISLNFYRIEVV